MRHFFHLKILRTLCFSAFTLFVTGCNNSESDLSKRQLTSAHDPDALALDRDDPETLDGSLNSKQSETVTIENLNWKWHYEGSPELVTTEFKFKENFTVSEITLKVSVSYNWRRREYDNGWYFVHPLGQGRDIIGHTISDKDIESYCPNGVDCNFIFGRGGMPWNTELLDLASNGKWSLFFYGIDGTHTKGGRVKSASLTLYE